MTILLEFKERLKSFCGNYEVYIKPLVKFIVALIAFFMLTGEIGFMTKLQNPAILLVLALVCAFLPANTTILIAAVLIIVHLYAASLEFALVMFVIFLLLCLLYFRFAPTYSYVLLLMPIACAVNIPFVIPIVMGLIATPVAAVPIACGAIASYLIGYAKVYAASLSGSEIDDMFQKYQYIIEHALNNKEMYLMVIACVATVILVYIIRRLTVDYAWLLATIVGAIAAVIIMISGDYIMEVPVNILGLIVGVAASVIIALVVQFFVLNLDYTRTERVQFEDDEYYYYVKAIPKVTIATKEKSVKKITVNRKKESSHYKEKAAGKISVDREEKV